MGWFLSYRKFFVKKNLKQNNLGFNDLNEILIHKIDNTDNNYDCILGNKFSVENFKISKIIKNHLVEFLKSPKLIFDKKKSLKFHFDLFHGKGNLDSAIELLDEEIKIILVII